MASVLDPFVFFLIIFCLSARCWCEIDRQAVVSRHNPRVEAATADQLDTTNDVFSVGNGMDLYISNISRLFAGAFVFNADITGLQTFNESYTHLGLNTLADWGWHITPFSPSDPDYAFGAYNWTYYTTPIDGQGHTRQVPYANSDNSSPEVVNWLNANPHRLNLGQVSLRWLDDGTSSTSELAMASVSNASQQLDMWNGILQSNFSLTSLPTVTCAMTPDNEEATYSCPKGSTIATVAWASYGQPSGSCAAGFIANPACDSGREKSVAVLSSLCVGRTSCSLLVNFQAGFGDPCHGQAKRLAANVTCTPSPASPPLPRWPETGAAPFPVSVQTAVHPDADLVALHVTCPSGPCPLALQLAFPYGNPDGVSGADWSQPARHTTSVMHNASGGRGGTIGFLRQLDATYVRVDCTWDGPLVMLRAGAHSFDLVPSAAAAGWTDASLSCLFSPLGDKGALAYPVGSWMPWMLDKARLTETLLQQPQDLPLFDKVSTAAAQFWAGYWAEGAFVDLASNTNASDAFELERRVILSQYLLRINDAGAEPPAETGLLCNSWSGKHHNEMRFWHQAHWPLWGHSDLLARSDGFFFDQLQNASAFAAFEGYEGAHWPKETAAVGNRSAQGIDAAWLGLDHIPWPFGGQANGTMLVWESVQVDNALVIWQQPHVIFLADLQRLAANASQGPAAAREVMQRLLPLVTATADYLVTRVYWNESDRGGRYWLGPPVMGGQEGGNPYYTYQPTFEVVYVGLVLDIAAEWLGLLGLPANPRYQAVASQLGDLPTDPASPLQSPLYTFDLHCVCMYLEGGVHNPACNPAWVLPSGSTCRPRNSHPLVVAPFGMLNGLRYGPRYGVNLTTMNTTLATVMQLWPQWTGAWGWDDSVLAMAMARLGWDPALIVSDALLDPKFPYYKNGQTLCCPTYLPGNGGLLLAIAVLAGGTDTSPPLYFPTHWHAQAEGFLFQYP